MVGRRLFPFRRAFWQVQTFNGRLVGKYTRLIVPWILRLWLHIGSKLNPVKHFLIPLESVCLRMAFIDAPAKVMGYLKPMNDHFPWKTNGFPLRINGWKMYFLLNWSLKRGHLLVFRGVCKNFILSLNKMLFQKALHVWDSRINP